MSRVVAIGGGHGLAVTLRALRRLPVDVTAVVSVADDGGSSGRIRADSGDVALGDLRKCLVALAADEKDPLVRAVAHRFDVGEFEGHSAGNLLLVAMSRSEGGLVRALDALSAKLGVEGRVLPATTAPVDLVADLADGTRVRGQVAVAQSAGIARVHTEPSVRACPEALDAIAEADAFVLGPGSLFTSVLAATVTGEITEAIAASSAPVVYVCNLRPQPHETDGYDVAAHVDALAAHGIRADVVVHDPDLIGPADGVPGALAAPLAAPGGRTHSPSLLAAALERALPLTS